MAATYDISLRELPDAGPPASRAARTPSDYRIELLRRALVEDCIRTESQASHAAAALNVSPSRLRHLFKQQTGVSFARFVKSVRMDRARGLLLVSSLSVKEIAARYAFHDVSHFVRDFKAAFGQSPTRLRAAQAQTLRAAVSANT
jgi:AraC-like DNA-binding protein